MAAVKSVVIGELFLFGEQSKAFLKTREHTSMDCEGWLFKITESKCLFPVFLLTCSILLVICMPHFTQVMKTELNPPVKVLLHVLFICQIFRACLQYLKEKTTQNIYSVTNKSKY